MGGPHSHWAHLILTPATQDNEQLGEGFRVSFDKIKVSPASTILFLGLRPSDLVPSLLSVPENKEWSWLGFCVLQPPVQHEGAHSNVQTPCVILGKFLLFSDPRDSISISLFKSHCEVFGGPHPPHPLFLCKRPVHPPRPVSSYLLFGPSWLTSPLPRSLGVCSGHLLPHPVPGCLVADKEL